MTDQEKLAQYESYRVYVSEVSQMLTRLAYTLFVVNNELSDESGTPLVGVTAEHITTATISQEQKDDFLFLALQKIEQFEQTADTLDSVTDGGFTNDIADAPEAPTPTLSGG
jgi:hypothetical protein